MSRKNRHINASDLQWSDKYITPLTNESVHIYKSHLRPTKAEIAHLIKILSDDEMSRADKFYFKKDKYSFIKARSTLRILLARYLQIHPKDISFSYGNHGKPEISNSSTQFNISHSANLGLFAFTISNDIGVDIEKVKPDIEFEALASRFFSPKEARIILSMADDQKAEFFYKCWTRKESFIKAHGEGLSMPLDCFEVSILDEEEVRLKSLLWNNEIHQKWHLSSFGLSDNYIAAMTTHRTIMNIEYIDFDSMQIWPLST